MMILVRYLDGSYDMVMNYHLESMISENRIVGFERSNRWVTIGIDPLRSEVSNYSGKERRSSITYEASDNP